MFGLFRIYVCVYENKNSFNSFSEYRVRFAKLFFFFITKSVILKYRRQGNKSGHTKKLIDNRDYCVYTSYTSV